MTATANGIGTYLLIGMAVLALMLTCISREDTKHYSAGLNLAIAVMVVLTWPYVLYRVITKPPVE